MQNIAPIAPTTSAPTLNITVIGFRRPKLLYTTLLMLRENYDIDGTPLYIFIDGARPHEKGEDEAVQETVALAENFEWNGEKKVFASEDNKGLQHGVRHAIDASLTDFEATLIVEDDIVTSPYFFRYAKKGLTYYKDDYNVAAICGHCYPLPARVSRRGYIPKTSYFIQHLSCWGWATWRRAWQQVCWDTSVLRAELKRVHGHRTLNFGIGEYVSGILEAQHNGYINTWDAQTGTSFFLNGQYCLHPPETLTNNTGWRFDDHSTHVRSFSNPNAPLAYSDFSDSIEVNVETHKGAWKAYNKMLYPAHKKPMLIYKKLRAEIAPYLRPIKRKLMPTKK